MFYASFELHLYLVEAVEVVNGLPSTTCPMFKVLAVHVGGSRVEC